MLRATSIVRKPAVKADKVTDKVVLSHEDRQRRRVMLSTAAGQEVLLDLDKPTVLNEGDALKLDDGRLVLVNAAVQPLLEIRAENPLRLMRVAWHVGNRHTPAEITADAIYIEEDHVLAEMIRGQGCSITPVSRAFQPERGAYDHGGHGHDHGHDHHAHEPAQEHDHHGHAHHGHDHHAHEHHAHEHHSHEHHAHGPDCGCGHDHHHHAHHSHDVLDVATASHAPGRHDDHAPGRDHEHRHAHEHGHGGHHKHDH